MFWNAKQAVKRKIYNYSEYKNAIYSDLFDFKFLEGELSHTIKVEKFINDENKTIDILKEEPITCFIKFTLPNKDYNKINVEKFLIYYQEQLIKEVKWN